MTMPAAAEPLESRKSVFQGDLPIGIKLERARTELLDLSARNRLLHIPRGSKTAKLVEVVDERSAEVFRLLLREHRAFTFLPGRAAQAGEDEDELAGLLPPEDDGFDERGVARRHADTRLQTRLTPPGLQKRLLDLWYDARALEEEQGANVLFLALGTLRWVDPNNAANIRHAPLILVPVSLERGNAAETFKLRARPEDVATNLSLETYLERVHGLKAPHLEVDDDFDPSTFFAAYAEAVAAKPGWAVEPDDIVLGFFSFAKFLMYRDLDPESWPAGAKLHEHALVRPLVADGFEEGEPLLDEDAAVDEHVSPADMVHIVDSDSSQTLAVHEVRRGRNLVIQGPPGTGKSQTIANVIAAAVADGKTVLFVAEKLAALEVVKRRLDSTGVGDACLELHSSKANKRAVLEDLRRTWELGAPRGEALQPLAARLGEARDRLNAHARRLHQPLGAAGWSPYQVIGHLTRLRRAGRRPTDLRLDGATAWTREGFNERSALVAELAERVDRLGAPIRHPWRGVGLTQILPPEVDRLVARVAELCARLDAVGAADAAIAAALERPAAATLAAAEDLAPLAARLAGAPALGPEALGAAAWRESGGAILIALDAGERHAALQAELAPVLKPQAWDADLALVREALAELPDGASSTVFDYARSLVEAVGRALPEVGRLASALGRAAAPGELQGVAELVRVAERVAEAPDADPQAFAAELWGAGVERAGDLAEAVRVLEAARAEVGAELTDAAWNTDLAKARQTLAAHGTGVLKVLSGEWRAADRLARSVQADPRLPLERRLALLDALGRGQAASAAVRADDALGRSAFGADWRGERSVSAPLLALVAWMRSLKGLGAEPRLAASRGPDRVRLAELAGRVSGLCAALRAPLVALWEALGAGGRTSAFAGASGPEHADLEAIAGVAARWGAADGLWTAVAARPEPDLARRRSALRDLERDKEALDALADAFDLGRTAFGSAWRGADGAWPALRAAADWVLSNLDVHELAARIADRHSLSERAVAAAAARNGLVADVERLLADLQAGDEAAATRGGVAHAPRGELAEALGAWRDEGEGLYRWVNYRAQAERASSLGLADLAARLHRGELAPPDATAQFEMAYFEEVFAAQVQLDGELARFDGELHDRAVATFADLDRQRIRHAALEVVRAHHRRIPPRAGATAGPLRVLKGEMAKRRAHLPIRRLMEGAAPAVQALKPVFMMSPLSVAQFLPPGALHFDLLVMDEASQIQPVDALGAIARARQVVVVGDPKQLPPTAFFAKMTANDADEDGDGPGASDIESILGLFTARGLPTRMLRWHYRSRHQSLIAVSNQRFYENKLHIPPSPFTEHSGLGLRFHHVVDGVFLAGSKRTNAVEAERVACAIVDHAALHPGESLGVVAFSAAQKKAIQEALETLRRNLPPEQEAFFQAHPSEPFFIKNLENVQGDERDVILISVGYGPTAPGTRPPMRFGPVGQQGGERRLNVLISRAKRRCEVFSSLTDEDIDPEFAASREGVSAFRLFLHFARTGRMATAGTAGRDRDEVFETQVAEALHAEGYVVHRRVGVSGIFVDVAVAHPDRPDRYILAVECDGGSYHGARSARDRDRLRRSVLEDHGWAVCRVWSADWFRRPRQQLDRLLAAVKAARAELAVATAAEREAATAYEIHPVEREAATELGPYAVAEAAAAGEPYVEARLTRPAHLLCDLHDTPTGALGALAEEVVAVEGPVHRDEITARIREAWDLKRSGARIQDAVARALAVSARQHRIVQDGAFYTLPGASCRVRDRSGARSPTLRRPEALPPDEIGAALRLCAGRNFGATEEQAIQAVSRALGFRATSVQLREAITAVLQRDLACGVLARRDSLIDVGPNAPAEAIAGPQPSALDVLVAAGEHGRLEFKETVRWDVRQQKPNKKLEDVIVKTIAAFANMEGGILLVGVRDDGTAAGLDDDIACCGGTRDAYELHLTHLVNARFGQAFKASKVRVGFPELQGRTICRIDVQPSREPVFVTVTDQGGVAAERLFARSGNASHEIPPSQIPGFLRDRFTPLERSFPVRL